MHRSKFTLKRENLGRYMKDLGMDPSSNPSPSDIKTSWKNLCRKHHPDVNGDVEEFKKVTHAYKMLTDPEYRQSEIVNDIKRGNSNRGGDLNIRIQVPISFEDAFFGREVFVSFNRLELDDKFVPIKKEDMDVVSKKILIPPGSFHGYEHLAEGFGHQRMNVFGNALMFFTPIPHPKFKTQRDDVISTEEIPLDIMLKGGSVEVLTMYGMETLRVPAGTVPGQELKIAKRGVLKMGNHVVQVTPKFPTKKELKDKDIWKNLNIDWKEQESQDKEAEELLNQYRIIINGGSPFGTSTTGGF